MQYYEAGVPMKQSKTFLFILLFVVAHFFHHLLTVVLSFSVHRKLPAVFP